MKGGLKTPIVSDHGGFVCFSNYCFLFFLRYQAVLKKIFWVLAGLSMNYSLVN